MATLFLLFFTFNVVGSLSTKAMQSFNHYFQDIFLVMGTRRVVIKPFNKFLVTTVAMATLFLYWF